jgi:hypothetical protein
MDRIMQLRQEAEQCRRAAAEIALSGDLRQRRLTELARALDNLADAEEAVDQWETASF